VTFSSALSASDIRQPSSTWLVHSKFCSWLPSLLTSGAWSLATLLENCVLCAICMMYSTPKPIFSVAGAQNMRICSQVNLKMYFIYLFIISSFINADINKVGSGDNSSHLCIRYMPDWVHGRGTDYPDRHFIMVFLNSSRKIKWGLYHFIPHPFQFIILLSSNNSTLYSLR
jgi:hypothetical protein